VYYVTWILSHAMDCNVPHYLGGCAGIAFARTFPIARSTERTGGARCKLENHSIRDVVYFRRVPLSSDGKPSPPVAQFINAEQAITTARRELVVWTSTATNCGDTPSIATKWRYE